MKAKILKPVLLVMAAVLLVVATVLGTMAYMTSTASVYNTFTVGSVKLTMYETKVDANGVALDPYQQTNNNVYNLMPGKTYLKDPTIVVDDSSAPSYLFVRIRNDIATIECTTDGHTHMTIEQQLQENGWYVIEDKNSERVYVYTGVANSNASTDAKLLGNNATSEENKVVVFKNFTVSPSVSQENLAIYASARVSLVAYAIQADLQGISPDGSPASYMAAWEAIVNEVPYENHDPHATQPSLPIEG